MPSRFQVVPILPIVILLFSSCTSSGVLQIGPDTYTITTTNEMSPAWAKQSAVKKADEYCRSRGKVVMVVQTSQGTHIDTFGDRLATYDYTFRCLDRADPELGRPEPALPTANVNVTSDVHAKVETLDSPEKDLYIELRKLEQLRNDGLLTDEEFEALKKKLIAEYLGDGSDPK